MILKVCAVYDLKAKAYMQPFFGGNVGSAMRGFGDEVTREGSPIAKHPEDYQLFELGNFDDNSGVIVGIVPCKLLCSANDYVKEVNGNG